MDGLVPLKTLRHLCIKDTSLPACLPSLTFLRSLVSTLRQLGPQGAFSCAASRLQATLTAQGPPPRPALRAASHGGRF